MQGRPLERDDGSDRRQLGGSHAGQQRAYYDDEGLYREAAEDDEEEEEDEEGGSGAAAMMLLDVDLYGGASGRQVLLPGGLEGAGLHQASEVRWGLQQASAIYCPVTGNNRSLHFDFLYLAQQCYGPLTSTCLLHLHPATRTESCTARHLQAPAATFPAQAEAAYVDSRPLQRQSLQAASQQQRPAGAGAGAVGTVTGLRSRWTGRACWSGLGSDASRTVRSASGR